MAHQAKFFKFEKNKNAICVFGLAGPTHTRSVNSKRITAGMAYIHTRSNALGLITLGEGEN